MPGIKVDLGAKDLASHPGEKITEGLDGLRSRLQECAGMGARFVKWRAVITPGDSLPSRGWIDANAYALARYAALFQEAGLVPIVEPEVLIDGMLLKLGIILPGLNCPEQASVDEMADATAISLLRVVPAAVPGIMFRSGSRSSMLAIARLNAMNVRFRPSEARLPSALAFSLVQAIQHPALVIWRGQEGSRVQAQQRLHDWAKLNRAACQVQCDANMEAA